MINHPFAGLVVKAVLVCYATWGVVIVSDLASCEARTPGKCESQRTVITTAASTIPATLFAWISDSPMTPGGAIKAATGRIPRRKTEEPEDGGRPS